MSMTPGSTREAKAEINVTPLIDVLLVLLIIFMVIQPTVMHGLDAFAPQPPNHIEHVEEPPAIVVQVLAGEDHQPAYRINETPFTRSELEPKLSAIFATRNSKVLFVKGETSLDFSAVAAVIDDAHKAGVDNIGILTLKTSALD
jgi:biopolymer transport protein ExbD/biopolymer transport protein TolR